METQSGPGVNMHRAIIVPDAPIYWKRINCRDLLRGFQLVRIGKQVMD